MGTQRALLREKEGDREYLEATLIDNNAGTFASPTLLPTFTLEVPDLIVADISVAYAAGGHRAADLYEIKALRRAMNGKNAVVELHSVTEGTREMPESWRVVGPIFVKVTATATGNGPSTGAGVENHLLAGVVLSPVVPMCDEDLRKRFAGTSLIPTKTFSSQD